MAKAAPRLTLKSLNSRLLWAEAALADHAQRLVHTEGVILGQAERIEKLEYARHYSKGRLSTFLDRLRWLVTGR